MVDAFIISQHTSLPSPRAISYISETVRLLARRDDYYDNNADDFDRSRPTRSGGRNNESRHQSGDFKQNKNNRNRSERGGRGGRGGGSRSESTTFRSPRQSPPIFEGATEITETNAHFFSKKALTEPTFYQYENENEIDNNQEIHQSLCQSAGISRPSRIQSLAWPQILSGKHTIVADQTGSGKTCAYLIPCLLRALQTPPTTPKKNGSPKVLILAPTAELADQIRTVCLKISDNGPSFSTTVVTANGKFTTSIRDQIRMIQRKPIDVLISTPGRISTILRTRNSGLDLSDVKSIVLDEVDILMIDETFGPQLRTVGAAAPLLDKTQFIFVTATLPDSIVQTITSEFPGVVQVKGPGLHRLAPSLKENLIDVSVPSDSNRNDELCFDVKAKQLLKALRQNRCRRTLVFCNTVDSCRSVENLLNRKDRNSRVFEVLAYHSAMAPEARNANLQLFAHGRQGDSQEKVDYILIW
jgi:ATP-dependent RNA helicase DDX18/HAS1